MTSAKKMIVVFVLFLLIVLSTGCGEENVSDRQARLIAVKNTELEKQIKTHEKTIAGLQKQLETCQQEKKQQAIEANENAQSMMGFLLEENKRLSEQLEKLKSQK